MPVVHLFINRKLQTYTITLFCGKKACGCLCVCVCVNVCIYRKKPEMVKSNISLCSVVMDDFYFFLYLFIDCQNSLQYACISSIMKWFKP